MAVYGPATGNYSRQSVLSARSSNGKSGARILDADSKGKAPTNARVGDYIRTAGGTFQITGDKVNGKWQVNQIADSKGNTMNGGGNNSVGNTGFLDNSAVKKSERLTGKQLSDMYGITYDYGEIFGKLNDAVNLKYKTLENDYKQNENTFYDSLYGLQGDALTNLKASRGNAIATGASAGVASANELLTMLGLGQEASTLATQLTQEKQQLSDKKVADVAQAKADALTYANQAGVNLGNLATQFNANDTQYSVAALDAIARIQQAQMEKEVGMDYNNAYRNANKGSYGSSGGSGGQFQSGTAAQYGSIDEMVKAGDFWSWASTLGLSTNLGEATKRWNELGKLTPAQAYAREVENNDKVVKEDQANGGGMGSYQSGVNNANTNNPPTTQILTDKLGRHYRYVNGQVRYIDGPGAPVRN